MGDTDVEGEVLEKKGGRSAGSLPRLLMAPFVSISMILGSLARARITILSDYAACMRRVR